MTSADAETSQTPQTHRIYSWAIAGWPSIGIGARIPLVLAALLSLALYCVGARLFDIPQLPGLDGSILAGETPVAAIVVILVLAAITALLGTVIAGRMRAEAGVFAAALGMMALSIRASNMQMVLFNADGSANIYGTLAGELVLLAAIILGVAFMLRALSRPAPGIEPPPRDLPGDIMAVITQAIVTAVVLALFCQNEAKDQCLASMAIAAIVGSCAAAGVFPGRPSLCYWLGPILLGVVAYLLAFSGQVGGLATGSPDGMLAPLVRPIPLDYAGVGIAGALVGHWIMTAEQ